MAIRHSLRAGADASSILEALLGSLVVGSNSDKRQQFGLGESWSALLSCPILAIDGPLMLNCAILMADQAFAPFGGGGAREKWRTLRRANDPLSLMATNCEEVCRQLHSSKTLDDIYKDKSLRSDLYEKFISLILM